MNNKLTKISFSMIGKTSHVNRKKFQQIYLNRNTLIVQIFIDYFKTTALGIYFSNDYFLFVKKYIIQIHHHVVNIPFLSIRLFLFFNLNPCLSFQIFLLEMVFNLVGSVIVGSSFSSSTNKYQFPGNFNFFFKNSSSYSGFSNGLGKRLLVFQLNILLFRLFLSLP